MASAILLRRVYDVETVTFLLSGNAKRQEEQAAKTAEVACRLGFPHHVLDLTQLFHEHVLKPFHDAWRSGKTPNPCVVCNPRIKFKALKTLASELDCAAIATGHYARVGKGNCISSVGLSYLAALPDVRVNAQHPRKVKSHSSGDANRDVAKADVVDKIRIEPPVFLYRGADPRRDQSYFMYRLTPDVLRHSIFPVGGLSKDEVRAIVAAEGLAGLAEGDSQDLCFLEGKSLRSYLEEQIGREEPGPFLDVEGRVIGEHDGIWQFTVGQRRRLGKAFGQRMTVLALDPERRAVTLGDESDAQMDAVMLEDYYFPYDMPHYFDATVKLRSQGVPLPVHVEIRSDTEALIRFDAPVRLSSPGQSAVLYEDDRVLGGGVVSRLFT